VPRHGQFEDCEDAVQEAVLAATMQWPGEGVPGNPRGWLATVASRRLMDKMRSDHARRERESAAATAEVAPEDVPDTDDTLVLLFLCCHPTLTEASQTALTQVHALYLILERIAPNPMVTLNRAIALAETEGPAAGLALLSTMDGDDRMTGHHRLLSARAHLLEKTGDTAGAYEHYWRAAKATASIAERRYLESRASRLGPQILSQSLH
jgi:predicted RNA polymerase sigma factor